MRLDREWLLALFNYLRHSRGNEFSGLGLVFYRQPMVLPVIGLSTMEMDVPDSVDARDVGEFLLRVSNLNSLNHDGFHLIDSATMRITHLSQFFSPPVNVEQVDIAEDSRPIGARYMAALLGSLIPSVEMTAVLGKKDDGIFFRRGKAVEPGEL